MNHIDSSKPCEASCKCSYFTSLPSDRGPTVKMGDLTKEHSIGEQFSVLKKNSCSGRQNLSSKQPRSQDQLTPLGKIEFCTRFIGYLCVFILDSAPTVAAARRLTQTAPGLALHGGNVSVGLFELSQTPRRNTLLPVCFPPIPSRLFFPHLAPPRFVSPLPWHALLLGK